jgi:hypothetical protein
MNAAVTEPRAWSPARRWSLITLVFAAHVSLILALGDRRPIQTRPPAPAPSLSLAPDSSEWLALNDPTLFALPQRRGFAGATWLKVPPVEPPPYRWTEAPRLLPIRLGDLGAVFAEFMRTNRVVSLAFESKPAPELPQPDALEIGVALPTRSALRVVWELGAARRLLNPPALPSWPAPDLLTNTGAQVLVNADGDVRSVTLLPPGSGEPKADQRALAVARAARFEPLRGASPALTLGVLIFEWHTEPLPAESKSPP